MGKFNLAAKLIGIGWIIAIPIALLTLLGRWLDSIWDADPVLTIIGVLLGVFVGLFGAYRMLQIAFKSD